MSDPDPATPDRAILATWGQFGTLNYRERLIAAEARAAERQRIREAVFARYARFASLEEEVPEWLADLLDGDGDE